MKKKRLIFYCIILMLFCQYLPVSAITEGQKEAIVENCDKIKDSLKTIQKSDARTRVYLGGYYETILTKLITTLNVRLVENNLSNGKLIENQNDFAANKTIFSNDYIGYQQELENLVNMNCKNDPNGFYEKLEIVRKKRKVIEQDTLKLRNLLSNHIKLVNGLMEKL